MIPDADRSYRDALKALPGALGESYSAVLSEGRVPLGGTEVTEAVLLRMGVFYDAQTKIKSALGKHYIGAGADFFVETILFFLRAIIDSHQLELEAVAERAVKRKRRAMRPDISIWRGSDCFAFIECKTQLGWDRLGWRSKFADREARMAADHPGALGFLLVMTTDNWAGFGDDPLVGDKYFVLSAKWPMERDLPEIRETIINPIEGLFGRILAAAKGVPTHQP